MAGVEVAFFDGGDEFAGFFFGVDMAQVGDEFGFLDFVEGFYAIVNFFDGAVAMHNAS